MSITLTQLNSRQKALQTCQPIHYIAIVNGYVPPMQYDLHYQWSIATRDSCFSVIQNFCMDNTIQFTTMRSCIHYLRCEAKLACKRIPGANPYVPTSPVHKIPSDKILFEQTVQLNIQPLGYQKAPCCTPLSNSTSPVYRVPGLQTSPAPKVRIMFQPDMPKQSTNFKAQSNLIPQPNELDFGVLKRQKFVPQVRGVTFTPWLASNSDQDETYINLMGMIGGKIYQVKHQILDGAKKLELKQKLNYQADELTSSFQVAPVHVTEPSERQFYLIADNFTHRSDSLTYTQIRECKRLSQTESVIVTPFNQVLIRYINQVDKGDDAQMEQFQQNFRKRIVATNGMQIISIGSGICEFVYNGNYAFGYAAMSSKQLLGDIEKSLSVNCTTNQTFLDQVVSISNLNGVPLRTVSCGYFNQQLYEAWQAAFQEYIQAGGKAPCGGGPLGGVDGPVDDQAAPDRGTAACHNEAAEGMPRFRPLVRISTFTAMKNGNYLVSGQAEVMLRDYPVILQTAMATVKGSGDKQLDAIDLDKTSMLTAVLLIISPTGSIIQSLYIVDILPNYLNCIEFLCLQTQTNRVQSEIPGFLTQSGYALNHSFIPQFDVSDQDCLCVLPRQGTILRINLQDLTAQKEYFEQKNKVGQQFSGVFSLSDAQQDLIMYVDQFACSSLSLLAQKAIQPNMLPIAISRLSKRLYVMVNNQLCNSVDVVVLSLPQFINQGAKDLQDIISEVDPDKDKADEEMPAEGDITVSESDQKTQEKEEFNVNDFTLLSRVILQENVQASSGSIIGLIKGGFAAAIKVDNQWRILEVHHGQCVFAGIAVAEQMSLCRKI